MVTGWGTERRRRPGRRRDPTDSWRSPRSTSGPARYYGGWDFAGWETGSNPSSWTAPSSIGPPIAGTRFSSPRRRRRYTGSTHPSCRISARLSADKAVDVGRAAHPAHAAAAPHCQPWPYWLFCPTPQTSRSAIRRSQGCPTRRPAIPFTLNCEEPRQVGTFAPVRILPSADGDSPSSRTS